jgi:hypothetical protein
MPKIFKALATITAWLLFIAGWVFLISSFIQWAAYGFAPEGWEPQAAFCGIGTASFVLSVVVMKLRQGMK